jgi:hypothetical protein
MIHFGDRRDRAVPELPSSVASNRSYLYLQD